MNQNSNNYLSSIGDDIGTDPTMVEVIDTLDIDDNVNQNAGQAKNKKNPKMLLKKILFAFGVLVLMGGVSFGLYFYLSIGQRRANEEKNQIVLENKEIYVGDALSDSIMDYGDFSKVDISKCSLDVSDVMTRVVGEYEYKVVCEDNTYTGKINVLEKLYFKLQNKIVYKKLNDTMSIVDFAYDDQNYVYEYENEEEVLAKLMEQGGPYPVHLKVKDSEKNEIKITSFMYVLEEVPALNLRCTSNKVENNNLTYEITDTFGFDNMKNNLNFRIRSYIYFFEDEEEYYNYVYKIKDGILEINEHKGMAIRDDINMTLTIAHEIGIDTLNTEYGGTFPSAFSEINSYYKNMRKYSCNS